jgi:hypothetical protein
MVNYHFELFFALNEFSQILKLLFNQPPKHVINSALCHEVQTFDTSLLTDPT